MDFSDSFARRVHFFVARWYNASSKRVGRTPKSGVSPCVDFQPILIGLMLVVAAEGAGFDQVGEWLGASWSGTRAIPDLSVQLLD